MGSKVLVLDHIMNNYTLLFITTMSKNSHQYLHLFKHIHKLTATLYSNTAWDGEFYWASTVATVFSWLAPPSRIPCRNCGPSSTSLCPLCLTPMRNSMSGFLVTLRAMLKKSQHWTRVSYQGFTWYSSHSCWGGLREMWSTRWQRR